MSTTSSSVRNWSLNSSQQQQLQSSSNSRLRNNASPAKETSISSNRPSSATTKSVNSSITNQHNQTSHQHSTGPTTAMASSSSSSMSSSSFFTQNPLNTQPLMTIRGTASIKQYHILNDKRFIVTKDTDENVCVWDVLQARRTESLGKENFEQAIKVISKHIEICPDPRYK